MTFEESLKQVMKTLPPVIRNYLVEEKYTPVAKSLMSKYGLRVDQAGVLEREIMLLLMGVETPDDFTEALAREASLEQGVIAGIVQDINDKIFMPLRKEEEKSAVAPAPVVTQRPTVAPAPHIAPLPPRVAMPVGKSSPLGDAVRAALASPNPLDSARLLEDHEEPHLEMREAATSPVIPKPEPIATPTNLPGALPPVTTGPQIRAEVPKPVAEAKSVSYSSDPYREPIDEPLG